MSSTSHAFHISSSPKNYALSTFNNSFVYKLGPRAIKLQEWCELGQNPRSTRLCTGRLSGSADMGRLSDPDSGRQIESRPLMLICPQAKLWQPNSDTWGSPTHPSSSEAMQALSPPSPGPGRSPPLEAQCSLQFRESLVQRVSPGAEDGLKMSVWGRGERRGSLRFGLNPTPCHPPSPSQASSTLLHQSWQSAFIPCLLAFRFPCSSSGPPARHK